MHIGESRQFPSGIFLYTLRPIRLAMLTEGPTARVQALAGAHWEYSINSECHFLPSDQVACGMTW
jgi:hypothetical protein